jgi:hypothetical protein
MIEESTWVGGTRMYQALASEVGRLTELVGVRTKELEGLARERDTAHALASERAAAMLVGGWVGRWRASCGWDNRMIDNQLHQPLVCSFSLLCRGALASMHLVPMCEPTPLQT